MVFTREPANKIVLSFTQNNLVIEANTPELGECREEVNIENEAKSGMSLGINAQFLIDALKEIDSPTILCGITGQMSPGKNFQRKRQGSYINYHAHSDQVSAPTADTGDAAETVSCI